MSNLDLSTLVRPNVLTTAVANVQANIAVVKDCFVQAKAALMLVDGTGSAQAPLGVASTKFIEAYQDTQTNASTALAGIDTFHGLVESVKSNIAGATDRLEFNQADFLANTAVAVNFAAIGLKLTEAKMAIVPLKSQIAAGRKDELDRKIAVLTKAQEKEDGLKDQLKKSMSGAVGLLGMDGDSSSMELFADMAPEELLGGLVDVIQKGGDVAGGAAEGPVGAGVAGTAATANIIGSLTDVIKLKQDLIEATADRQQAELDLKKLKQDQAAIDPGARLSNALIYMAQIETRFSDLTSQLTQLGSIYAIMANELKNALNLIDDKKYEQAKRGLVCADAVLVALQPALDTFSTAA
ncbi:hypothetical protein MKEN_00205600 [Mycena kentingensis (nom. inval.)]|nr:hypothetical protein MKEN_00205600 [Mycena kentingensis (nom. inval.)]